MKRRKIPVLKIRNLQSNSKLADIPGAKDLILNETFIAIKDGIDRKKIKTPLFGVSNSNTLIELKKDKWKQVLETTLEYFVEKEDYNKCIEIRDLIKKL